MKALIASSVLCLLAAIAYSLFGSAENPSAAGRDPRGSAAAHVRAAAEPLDLPEREITDDEPAADVEPAVEAPGLGEENDEPFDATIRGRVVTAGPLPANVRVVLEAEVSCGPDEDVCDRPRRAVDVDAETGDFEVEVPPGTYTIVARSPQYLPSAETGLKVSANENVEGVMLTLESGGHITGLVYSEREPAQMVRVTATGNGYSRSDFTDDLGHFDLAGLPPGEFRVVAYSSDKGGDEKLVRSGANVSLELARRRHLRGRVVDSRGFPVEGAVVSSDFSVTNTAPDSDPFPSDYENFYEGDMSSHDCSPAPDCYVRAVTDSAGQFELETSPGEELTIAATHAGDRAELSRVAYDSPPIELALAGPTRVHLVDATGQSHGGTVHFGGGSLFSEADLVAGADGWLSVPAGAHPGATLSLPFPLHVDSEVPEGITVQELQDPDAPTPWQANHAMRGERADIIIF